MTTPQPTPEAQFSALLSRFPAETVALAKRCLPMLRRAFPVSHELVYDYSSSLVVSFGMSERGYEAIVSLAIAADSVRLYFAKSLPDPTGLLKGTGTKVRSMTVKAASDLERPDVKALIDAAIDHAGVTFTDPPSTRMLIKSKSKSRSAGK